MKAHVDRTAWMDKAACRNWAGRVFLWELGSRGLNDANERNKLKRARAVCEGCPVRRQCLEFALESEQAGSTSLGMAQFAWRQRDDKGNFTGSYRLTWREFTASVTPPYGIWGGFLPSERHAKYAKHEHLVANVCVRGFKCPGCRPISEWAEILLEGDAAA